MYLALRWLIGRTGQVNLARHLVHRHLAHCGHVHFIIIIVSGVVTLVVAAIVRAGIITKCKIVMLS